MRKRVAKPVIGVSSQKIASLDTRIRAIERRNTSVELDKAWEVSLARRLAITVLSYAVVSAYLLVIESERPFVTAVVPAAGYFMSTLVIKKMKNWWIRK